MRGKHLHEQRIPHIRSHPNISGSLAGQNIFSGTVWGALTHSCRTSRGVIVTTHNILLIALVYYQMCTTQSLLMQNKTMCAVHRVPLSNSSRKITCPSWDSPKLMKSCNLVNCTVYTGIKPTSLQYHYQVIEKNRLSTSIDVKYVINPLITNAKKPIEISQTKENTSH